MAKPAKMSLSEALFSIALASAAFLAAIRADASQLQSQKATFVSKACCLNHSIEALVP